MKILGISASPKKKESSSEHLLKGLKSYMNQGENMEILPLNKVDNKKLTKYDALVISFPLYVDGVPSHLVEWMVRVEEELQKAQQKVRVYVLVNAGFFEAEQNRYAIEIMKNWCRACRVQFGGAIGYSGGGMAQMAPVGTWPNKTVGKAMAQMARSIEEETPFENLFIKPNFPRFLYMQIGQMGWKKQGKSNGLSPKELYSRWQD